MNRKELVEQIFAKKSFLCVGLDTDIDKLPVCITESEEIQGAEASMIFKFNKAIIDATAPYCVAYKPNLAFYESRGVYGMIAFENTVKYLKKYYPTSSSQMLSVAISVIHPRCMHRLSSRSMISTLSPWLLTWARIL